jgi:hypothetical protein
LHWFGHFAKNITIFEKYGFSVEKKWNKSTNLSTRWSRSNFCNDEVYASDRLFLLPFPVKEVKWEYVPVSKMKLSKPATAHMLDSMRRCYCWEQKLEMEHDQISGNPSIHFIWETLEFVISKENNSLNVAWSKSGDEVDDLQNWSRILCHFSWIIWSRCLLH